MSEGSDEHLDQNGGLSRSRADFVGTFERRLDGLSSALEELGREPDSAARRDHVLRRIHALGAAAKVLGFAAAAEQLGGLEELLKAPPSDSDVASQLSQAMAAINLLPQLVVRARREPGGAADAQTLAPPRPGELLATEADALGPIAVLVFGSEALAATLQAAASPTELELECCDDPDGAFERILAFGPDVVVVEGEHARAAEFLGAFSNRSETVQAPIVLVRSPQRQSQPVARTLRAGGVPVSLVEGPVRGHELWLAIQQSLRSVALSDSSDELPSEFTLNDLAEYLALEVRRALLGAALPADTEISLHVERPSEILAPLWGALARIRETVTALSKGSVEFAPLGPEGAVVVAPRPGESRSPGVRAHGDGVTLEGRSALVVDDDPTVAWFIAGLLRAAGAQAVEAHDGRRGLDLALSLWPDIIISDVFMPELDGLALCREIKRDVAVSDTPVILLSWKEDLLLRLRELRADADGYVRKEASASSILRTVRELLAPRARVEARLSSEGEVRGRLDRLTPRLILELVSERRPDACLVLRDPAFLYEVQIRNGRLRCVTRTAADGSFDRGPSVLAALLGVTAGRFVVTTETARCHDDFTGTLQEVLTEPIRRARAALRATSASMLGTLKRVSVDASIMQPYLGVMPVQAAQLLRQMIEGASPRALLLSGDVPPQVLEHVLSDAARKGALVTAEGRGGQDVLAEALGQETDATTRAKTEPLAPADAADQAPRTNPPALASMGSVAPEIRTLDSPEIRTLDSADAGSARTASAEITIGAVGGEGGSLQPGDRARFVSLPLLRLDQGRRLADIEPPAVSLQPPPTGEIDEAWGSEPPGQLVAHSGDGVRGAAAPGRSWSGERGTHPDVGSPREASRDHGGESTAKPAAEALALAHRGAEPEASEPAVADSRAQTGTLADEARASGPHESTASEPKAEPGSERHLPAPPAAETSSEHAGARAAVTVGLDLADAVLHAMVEAGTGTPPPVVAEPQPAAVPSTSAAPEQADVVQGALGPIVLDPDTSEEAPSSHGTEPEKLRSLRRPVAPSLDSVRGTSAALWSSQFAPRASAGHWQEGDASLAHHPPQETAEGDAVQGRKAPLPGNVVSPPRPSPPTPVEPSESSTQESTPLAAEFESQSAQASSASEREVQDGPAPQPEPHIPAEQEKTPAEPDRDTSDSKPQAQAPAAQPFPGENDRVQAPGPRAPVHKDATAKPGTAKAAESSEPTGAGGLLRLSGMALIAGVVSYAAVTAGTYLLGLRGSNDSEPATGDSAQPGEPDGPTESKRPQAPASSTPAVQPQTLPLPPGVTVAAGQGLLEVQTGARHAIYVDGEFVGRGPSRRIPVPAGRHEVRLSLGGADQRMAVQVAAGVRVVLPLGGT
ncbi:MAG: response regulator [Polyangiaceae bacterium]|nr:response regulator [Polyangiaceae bacterium]